ncbi:unnamed protein product [Rangifer tarandus platyrhynchus]|uniref:Uncharacterized protein n=2 Tax=Rangifer tarandus platyrhynchus TaxID=3082113 RepID=A0ACB0F9A6_RANTA|nr:unnamed protein product [Rangifer tarandus platyrhynchus]CAI9709652.1 unnamed protein product [Rangifer tarandus platyrhynchus]
MLFPDPSVSGGYGLFNKTEQPQPLFPTNTSTLLSSGNCHRHPWSVTPGSPPVSKIVSSPFPKKRPRFCKGENALPPFPLFTSEFKCLTFCGHILPTERSYKLPTMGSSRARCSPHQVPDRRGAPGPRLAAESRRCPGLSRVRGAGRDGEGREQYRRAPRPSQRWELGGGRGGGGTAAPGSTVGAGRRVPQGPPGLAPAGPRLPPLPWHRPARCAGPRARPRGRVGCERFPAVRTRTPLLLLPNGAARGVSAAEREERRSGSSSQEQELRPRFYPGLSPDLSFSTTRPFSCGTYRK